ncbi:MAG: hypothetical protein KatS3mg113_0658 [Planctomycetaceae bacterium]|nr:MAG: hypothetical protein KatS3mg113_0658 [Planctomycetaceae bacterium]
MHMDVRAVGSTPGVSPLGSVKATSPSAQTPAKVSAPQDELEISAAGQMLDQLSQTSNLRQERLARIKAEIDQGTYDSDEKLEAALLKLMQVHGLQIPE